MKAITVMRNTAKGSLTYPPDKSSNDEAYTFHQSLPEYQPTPLLELKELANSLGIADLYVKDESKRFGLNAFKGLGASYAIHKVTSSADSVVKGFISCTDGNHGRAVAWISQKLGYPCIILMPNGSLQERATAIRQFGADVSITDMNYDDTVRYASELASKKGYCLVQDTSLPGYHDIPQYIVTGYETMIREAIDQISVKPTHVFVQAGVGSFAGGAVKYLNHYYGLENLPIIGIIESDVAPCIFESVKQGHEVSIGGLPHTIMAGLNCGEVNSDTFPYIEASVDYLIKCNDDISVRGTKRAKSPVGTDPSYSSGESGSVTLGFLEKVICDPEFSREKALKARSLICSDLREKTFTK